MDIKIIKDILDDAKECGCIAGISLSNGQLTHANFSKSPGMYSNLSIA